MKKQQHVFIQYLSSILGVCVFIALLVFAIIMLSYLFIIAAVIGLILFVEAKNIGIDISNKETTSQHLNNFLDPNQQSKLSLDKGFREANRYANGGMEILKRKIPEPQLLGEFLIKYQDILKEELKDNSNFN